MTKSKDLVPKETISARFVEAITREFISTAGDLPVKFDEKKKRLAQHLFIQMDAELAVLEKKRLDSGSKGQNKPEIAWKNINMIKLALDAMRRIELGLDALIPNHISIIPYLNGRTKQYDVDLRIGYAGNDYYRRKMAVEVPVDIRYELVHETDKLVVIKKSATIDVETYEFEVSKPFERGKVVGGFGYIIFTDKAKNELVLVSEEDFLASKGYSQTDKFWGPHPNAMRYKTLVHRTTSKLQIDPDKVTPAYAVVEAEEAALLADEKRSPEEHLSDSVREQANKEVIDIKPEPETPARSEGADEITAEEKKEILKEEAKEAEKTEGDGPGF